MPKKLGKIKERNRDRNLVYQLIFELSKLYDSECEMCLKVMKMPKPGFVIHHCEYVEGEKTHKDFRSRLKYYKYLGPIVQNRAKEGTLHRYFAFLCNQCHHSLDGPRGLNRRKKMNVLRMFLLWFRTNT